MAEVLWPAAAILAAGRSRRMGRSKPLLLLPAGETFVTRQLRTLRAAGVPYMCVVGREGDGDLRDAVTGSGVAAEYLENADAHQGQLSSVLVGIRYAQRVCASGLLILPVDVPLVTSATVAHLVAAWREGSRPIARVTHRGCHGHPVIVAAALFQELRDADPEIGARAVIRRDPARVLEVDVPDPGVLRDFDHPEDYRTLFEP